MVVHLQEREIEGHKQWSWLLEQVSSLPWYTEVRQYTLLHIITHDAHNDNEIATHAHTRHSWSCGAIYYTVQYSTVDKHQINYIHTYCMTATVTYVHMVYHSKLLIQWYFSFALLIRSRQYHASIVSGSWDLLYHTVVVLVCNTHQPMHSYRRCAGCHWLTYMSISHNTMQTLYTTSTLIGWHSMCTDFSVSRKWKGV